MPSRRDTLIVIGIWRKNCTHGMSQKRVGDPSIKPPHRVANTWGTPSFLCRCSPRGAVFCCSHACVRAPTPSGSALLHWHAVASCMPASPCPRPSRLLADSSTPASSAGWGKAIVKANAVTLGNPFCVSCRAHYECLHYPGSTAIRPAAAPTERRVAAPRRDAKAPARLSAASISAAVRIFIRARISCTLNFTGRIRTDLLCVIPPTIRHLAHCSFSFS